MNYEVVHFACVQVIVLPSPVAVKENVPADVSLVAVAPYVQPPGKADHLALDPAQIAAPADGLLIDSGSRIHIEAPDCALLTTL